MRRRKTLLITVANANDDVNDRICIKMVTVEPGLWFSMRISVLEHLCAGQSPWGRWLEIFPEEWGLLRRADRALFPEGLGEADLPRWLL